MNLYNKKICILGFNDCFAKALLDNLLHHKAQVEVIEEPSKGYGLDHSNFLDNLLFNKSTFEDHQINIIKEADIIINLTLAPTPKNLAKDIYNTIKFNEYVVNSLKPSGFFIHLTPLIAKDSFSAYHSLFNKVSTIISHNLSNYSILKVGHIIAPEDSFLRDICDLMYLTGVSIPYSKNRVSIIDKTLLVLSIIKIIEGNNSNKNYDLAYVSQFQIQELVSIVAKNLFGKDYVKVLPMILVNLMLFMKKKSLYFLHKNYFNTIIYSKKTSVSTLGLKDLGISTPSLEFIINQELSSFFNQRKNHLP